MPKSVWELMGARSGEVRREKPKPASVPINERNPKQQQREILAQFWAILGGYKNAGYRLSPKVKRDLLVQYARIVIPPRGKMTLEHRRNIFNKWKQDFHKFETFPKCFLCLDRWASVRHHIIQLQNGGPNTKNNIVSLCGGCHAIIHPHLRSSEPQFQK